MQITAYPAIQFTGRKKTQVFLFCLCKRPDEPGNTSPGDTQV